MLVFDVPIEVLRLVKALVTVVFRALVGPLASVGIDVIL